MPVHGDAPFIDQAIRSVEAQTIDSWELIIIQDRPAPKTIKICNDAKARSARIHLLESESTGISSALNTGLGITSTPFVARIDSDDIMKPNRLLSQLEVMEKTPNLVGLGSQAEYIDSRGTVTGRSNYPISNLEIRTLLPFLNPFIHPSMMLRSASIKSIGGYMPELDGVEDYNLWLRLLPLGQLENLDQYLIQYRMHQDQTSEKNRRLNSSLQRIARLNALGVDTKPSSTSWVAHFASKETKEMNLEISLLESKATKTIQRCLRSARGLSDFLSIKTPTRFFQLFSAIVNAPIRSSAALYLVTRGKMKSWTWKK
jgi:glycosyltransferase involved in cell wall biosynthesis